MYRENDKSLKINLPNNEARNLYIFVENMGRLNFGNDYLDAKVIWYFKLPNKLIYFKQ